MKSATSVAIGMFTGCTTSTTGDVTCWGVNLNGEFGNGQTSMTPAGPSAGATGIHTAVRVRARNTHLCALLVDKTIRCWGYDDHGQIGDGQPGVAVPVPFDPMLTGVSHVDVGYDFTCAVLEGAVNGSSVLCWGHNNYGQLGLGDTMDRYSPEPVPSLWAGNVVLGTAHACAPTGSGLFCWGKPGGNPASSAMETQPTQVSLQFPANILAAGLDDSCASDGNSTWCWGGDSNAELTSAYPQGSAQPVAIPALSGISAIAFGDIHGCGIFPDGSIRCWGDNSAGQLGDGTTAPHADPMPVAW